MIHAYLRVSTREQGASGLGLEAQEAAIRSWASARSGTLEIVREVGSGAGDQPLLAELVGRLQPGDILVAAKLDRLGRSTRRVLDLAERLDRGGVDLVALDLALDTTTPAGRLVLTVLAALAEWERQVISERTRAALAVKSAMGELAKPHRGTPPAVVARIRELRDRGETLRAICDTLRHEGIPTPQGGEWRPGTVAYLLKKHAHAARP